ncbi:MAG: hypothetical protein PHQ22_01360 [Sulfuricurvum sp.]|nr:hypothetical protein [Sulfuricurvum sp.]MDD5385827.1 hypothetical protein [Sulfuricurvum sp.]
MNTVLLSNGVIALLFTETILYVLAFVAFVWGLKIYKNWNFESLASSQYLLEKKNYFTTTVIVFILGVKFVLLPLFAHIVDGLSDLVPGAMCGAGVISANDYGMPIFIIKLLVLFLGVCWSIANTIDLQNNYAYTKRKYELFFGIFILLTLEFLLQGLYFTHISLESPVMCCSVIYGASNSGSTLPLSLSPSTLSIAFGILFIMLFIALINKIKILSFVLGALFLYFGYYFVLHIVGIYVYELPTHICPFCMLQREYFYIGYLLWGSLFLGSFFSMAPLVLEGLIHQESKRSFSVAIFFNLLLAIIALYFIVGFYLKNGVWL